MPRRYKPGKFKLEHVGTKYGRLTVMSRAPDAMYRGQHITRWLCGCDCGGQKIVQGTNLRKGNVKSCGCMAGRISASCRAAAIAARRKVNPKRQQPEYHAWHSARQRCNNSRNPQYSDYGGRGIKVCPAWNNVESGYETFLVDLGRRPGPAYSLDRIDVDGDYEPFNCRWAISKVQIRNRRPYMCVGESASTEQHLLAMFPTATKDQLAKMEREIAAATRRADSSRDRTRAS